MDSFEFNKIAGAVLAALLVFFGLREVSHVVFSEQAPEKPGYVVAVQSDSGSSTSSQAAKKEEKKVPIGVLLASADVEKGKKVIKKCVSCHTLEKDGKNKVGPNLWDIVGRKYAGLEAFAYSKALKAKEGTWSYEDLDAFFEKPKAWLPGTKMVFRGISKPQQRADLILYLRSLSDSPKPLPENSAATGDEASKDKS